MSTRSFIGIQNGDDVKVIYCHWDGYPKGVGLTLIEQYNDIEEIEELINGGDCSSIIDGPDYYVNRGDDWEDVKPKIFNVENLDNEMTYNCIDYAYIWNEIDQCWGIYKLDGTYNGDDLGSVLEFDYKVKF